MPFRFMIFNPLFGGKMKLVKEGERPIHPNQDDIRNQMSLISDTDEILKFLEMAGKRSILNEHTVNCRLTACHNLFSILNVGEDNVDYMLQNLDLLVNRFRNKNSSVQASTLKVYKSRLKNTLEDFVCWSKDSVGWERSVLEKANQAQKEKRGKASAPAAPTAAEKGRPASSGRPGRPARVTPPPPVVTRHLEGETPRKVSFPIRSDFNVEITLPADGLTAKEVLKLGLFLFPYCKDIEGREESVWPTLTGAPN